MKFHRKNSLEFQGKKMWLAVYTQTIFLFGIMDSDLKENITCKCKSDKKGRKTECLCRVSSI
jgi:hypothetical protein